MFSGSSVSLGDLSVSLFPSVVGPALLLAVRVSGHLSRTVRILKNKMDFVFRTLHMSYAPHLVYVSISHIYNNISYTSGTHHGTLPETDLQSLNRTRSTLLLNIPSIAWNSSPLQY